jgi:hypothetical protein
MATTFSATDLTSTRRGGRHPGVALLVIATAQLMVVLDSNYPPANTAGRGAWRGAAGQRYSGRPPRGTGRAA